MTFWNLFALKCSQENISLLPFYSQQVPNVIKVNLRSSRLTEVDKQYKNIRLCQTCTVQLSITWRLALLEALELFPPSVTHPVRRCSSPELVTLFPAESVKISPTPPLCFSALQTCWNICPCLFSQRGSRMPLKRLSK